MSSGHVHVDTGDPTTGEGGGSVCKILRVAPLFMCRVLLFLSLLQQGWKWVRTYPKGDGNERKRALYLDSLTRGI